MENDEGLCPAMRRAAAADRAPNLILLDSRNGTPVASPPLAGSAHLLLRWGYAGSAKIAAALIGYLGLGAVVRRILDQGIDLADAGKLLLIAVLAAVPAAGLWWWSRFVDYSVTHWLGEVAHRVASEYDVDWSKVNQVCGYLPFARPLVPARRSREYRLSDRAGWSEQNETFAIYVPTKSGQPIRVYATPALAEQMRARRRGTEVLTEKLTSTPPSGPAPLQQADDYRGDAHSKRHGQPGPRLAETRIGDGGNGVFQPQTTTDSKQAAAENRR